MFWVWCWPASRSGWRGVQRRAGWHCTYGFGKAPVLAAMANGVVLLLVSGGIVIEAIQRLFQPQPVQAPGIVMIVALVGVVANSATALMFIGKTADINVRAVFLHMAGDALVSVGVIAAAGLIMLTGWTWLDPAVSVVIVAVIVMGTWSLLREAIDMAMDAAPDGADVPTIEAFLTGCEGVTEVHDLHIWAMSTTEVALTAHLVRPDHDGQDGFRFALTAWPCATASASAATPPCRSNNPGATTALSARTDVTRPRPCASGSCLGLADRSLVPIWRPLLNQNKTTCPCSLYGTLLTVRLPR